MPDQATPLRVDFGDALQALRAGKRVRRMAWPSALYLTVVWPADGSLPVIQLARASWRPTHADLLAVDWVIVG